MCCSLPEEKGVTWLVMYPTLKEKKKDASNLQVSPTSWCQNMQIKNIFILYK